MSGSLSTGGIDASIPLQAGKGVQQPNPLQTIGEFANAKNAINNLQLFPGQLQQQQQATQNNQVSLAQHINSAGYGALAPLLATPAGGITHSNFTSALASIEANLGLPTSGIMQDVAKTAPTGDGPDFDAKIRSLIASRMQTSPDSALAAVTPRQGTVDVGPSIQPVNIATAGMPNQGQVTPVGGAFVKGLGPQFVNTGAGSVATNNGQPTGAVPIANQLSPAQLATPVQIGIDPKGAPIMGTLGQFLDKAGAQPSPLGTGRLPPALLNPARQQRPGVVTGQGPAQQASQAAQGATSAHAFQDIADQGVQARGQNAVLGNMLGDIGAFTPGPTGWNNFKNWMVRNGAAISTTFGLDPTSVAANESFDKLANQIAGAQGERSDARLSVAQAANPGSHLSPGGADLILRQLQGNADYLQARAKLAAIYPDQTNRAAFEAGNGLDPRAFQFARMTGPQKTQYAATLSPADRALVQKAYNSAVGQGLIGGQ
jgi:hypothetical protein